MGHSESNTRRCAVEPKKGVSAVQAAQATVTYLQRHALAALLGVVTDDAPDEDDRPDSRATGVDARRNLRVASRLRARGIDPSEAEEQAGRPVAEWTAEDIEAIGAWVRRRDEDTVEREPGEDDEPFEGEE
jgi:hypothetical protein